MPSPKPGATHVMLKGSTRFHRPGSVVIGNSNPQEVCEVTVKVRRRAPLPQPDPAHPLGKAELTAKFGADQSDLDTVAKVLAPYGITVQSASELTHSVKVVGPVSAMELAFGVKLSRVRHDNITYRGRVGAVHIPIALNDIVTGVFGLDTRPMLKPKRIRFAQAATTLPSPDQRPWYIPQELADAYQFPQGDGSGQTIAILEFAGTYLPDDLTAFLSLIGMPTAAPNVVVRNIQTLATEDQNDPDATGEVMLDVEVVAALCPKATIVLMFSRWGENGWISNIDAILTDPAAPSIVSVSYGLAEGTDIWTQDAINSINDALQAVANAGITVCVSSGDDGSQDQVTDGAAHVDFPASSPYVLSVGGTSLQKSTGTEISWFEGDGLRADGGGSGGGGVSAFNTRPSWQNININSVNPHSIEGRIVPDVSANAAGGTGYLIYAPTSSLSSSSAQVAGGTSAATPLWAALLARLQEAGKTIGFITPKLYQTSPASSGSPVGTVALRDITQGNNASGKSPGYSATVGFDAVTGWGTPNGKTLAEFLP